MHARGYSIDWEWDLRSTESDLDRGDLASEMERYNDDVAGCLGPPLGQATTDDDRLTVHLHLDGQGKARRVVAGMVRKAARSRWFEDTAEMTCIRRLLEAVDIGPGTAGGASTAIFFTPELGGSW